MKQSSLIKKLRVRAGWDGKYPIPMDVGNAGIGDYKNENVVHFSADDRCVWIGTVESAWELFSKHGCKIIKDEKVLDKRASYLKNPVFKKQYPLWYEGFKVRLVKSRPHFLIKIEN